MSHKGQSMDGAAGAAPQMTRKEDSIEVIAEQQSAKSGKGRRSRYTDMQSAARFPIKLPVAVKAEGGDQTAETQNISANGVLFRLDSDMPVGSLVDFTISFPADVVGSDNDVRVDCRGRVVRSYDEEGGRRGVGVVIDEYHFER